MRQMIITASRADLLAKRPVILYQSQSWLVLPIAGKMVTYSGQGGSTAKGPQ